MKQILIPVVLALSVFFGAASGQGSTIASAIDREITDVEKQITDAAEAMPESKFEFSPENLHIDGGGYRGVRTFALQIRHIAASNYAIWSSVTGDQFPKDFYGSNGPENLTTKAAILKFLKDSFALGHKAASMLTLENMLQPPEHSKSTRLRVAVFGVEHAYDHYGQIVEYLRMNGIVPPAGSGRRGGGHVGTLPSESRANRNLGGGGQVDGKRPARGFAEGTAPLRDR